MKRLWLFLVLALAAGCGGGEPPKESPPEGDPEEFRRTAISLHRQGDLQGALSQAARALAAEPFRRESYELLSRIYVELADDERAVGFFETGTRRFPELPEFWYYKGFHEFRLNRWADALASFERASKLDPDDPVNYFRQGLILQTMGDFDAALEKLHRAHELDPSDPVTAARLSRLLRITGAYGQAEAVVTEAMALSPDSADLHYALGQLLLRDGRDEEAETALRRSIALSPNRWEAHHDLARLLSRTNREEEGEAEMFRAVRLRDYLETRDSLFQRMAVSPSDPEPALALAELDLTERNIQDARRWLNRAQGLSGPEDRIGTLRVEISVLEGNLEAAAVTLGMLGNAPDPRADLARAAFHLAAGRTEEGLRRLARALSEAPSERPFLRRAADLYEKAGMRPEAVNLLLQAASLQPSPPGEPAREM